MLTILEFFHGFTSASVFPADSIYLFSLELCSLAPPGLRLPSSLSEAVSEDWTSLASQEDSNSKVLVLILFFLKIRLIFSSCFCLTLGSLQSLSSLHCCYYILLFSYPVFYCCVFHDHLSHLPFLELLPPRLTILLFLFFL